MIKSFQGHNRFLSNFYPATVRYAGAVYPTVENAYQAAKITNPNLRKSFLLCTPGQSKRLSRSYPLRPGWDDMKYAVMKFLVTQKFMNHLELKNLLLATGNLELIEGNTWGDTYWGVCNGKGENNLGKILMEVRSKL